MTDTPDTPDTQQTGETLPTRRDMLDQVLTVGGVVWAAGVAVPAAFFLWPARARGPGEEFGSAGPVAEFEVGTERMINVAGKPVMVLRVKEDEFTAFSAVCTHLACIVKWDRKSGQVACPCHAGFFAPDGTVISGPPPRPLTPYRVVVLGDEVRVYP